MQEIIVCIIGGLLAMYVARSVWRLVKRRDDDPCAGCTGCDARDEFLKHRGSCGCGK